MPRRCESRAVVAPLSGTCPAQLEIFSADREVVTRQERSIPLRGSNLRNSLGDDQVAFNRCPLACSIRFDSNQIASARKSGSLLAEGNESRIDRGNREHGTAGEPPWADLRANYPRRDESRRIVGNAEADARGRSNVEVVEEFEAIRNAIRPRDRERRPPVRRLPFALAATPAYNNSRCTRWR